MLRNEIDFNVNGAIWVSKIKDLLERTGFPDIWMFQSLVDIIVKFIATLSQWWEGMLFSDITCLVHGFISTFKRLFIF